MAANQMKHRMQSLGLLDRSFKAATDDELNQAIEALGDEHREAIAQFVGDQVGPDELRAGAKTGRIDGGMEAIAAVVTDACLADCIERLGDHADNPSSDQLREVLPGIVEDHNVGITRIMLASTVAGDAPAAAIIRDLLKHDELVALPAVEEIDTAPTIVSTARRSEDEQTAIREKRKAAKAAKKEAERARKAQAAADKHR